MRVLLYGHASMGAVCLLAVCQVVKLSDAVQPLPRQTTEFVHGVPSSFLEVGKKKAVAAAADAPRFSKGVYFMGKAMWAKGYSELLDLLEHHKVGALRRGLLGALQPEQASRPLRLLPHLWTPGPRIRAITLALWSRV
jgi:hypothetical protein